MKRRARFFHMYGCHLAGLLELLRVLAHSILARQSAFRQELGTGPAKKQQDQYSRPEQTTCNQHYTSGKIDETMLR